MLLYIDPGTGSMLFTIILGVVTTLFFSLKGLVIKLKNTSFENLFKSGKNNQADEKIPYVIYTDSKRYANVFKPICDEFEKRQVKLQYLTQSKDDPLLEAGYKYVVCKFIGEGNRAFPILNTLNADTVISTTPGLDVYQWKRSKYVNRYVHVFHDLSDSTGYEMFGLDYYDEILLTGEVQSRYIREIEKKRNLPSKKLYTTGSIYLDEMLKKADSLKHQPRSRQDIPTVLLAPSWGKNSILNRFGDEVLRALAATGYNIVVRPHPQTALVEAEFLESLMKKYPDSELFHWNFDNDNFKVLHDSDMMITDYSEIKSDYALIFNRPYIYLDTSLNLATYDAAWIDGPLYRIEMIPLMGKKIGEEDFDNLRTIIDSVMNNDSYSDGRKQVKSELWAYQGESIKRTMDYLLGGDEK